MWALHTLVHAWASFHPDTVQDDLLAREIFGEFVSEIQLADFILVILL